MMALARYYTHDLMVREGVEYSDAFWRLHNLIHQQRRTEQKWMYAKVAEERAEFIRQVKDNDRIGRRAYLPFRWRSDGSKAQYRYDSFAFRLKVERFDARLREIRAAIPGGFEMPYVEVPR